MMSSENIDWYDIPPGASELIRQIGSVALEEDFNFTESEINLLIDERGLSDIRSKIFEKLFYLGINEIKVNDN